MFVRNVLSLRTGGHGKTNVQGSAKPRAGALTLNMSAVCQSNVNTSILPVADEIECIIYGYISNIILISTDHFSAFRFRIRDFVSKNRPSRIRRIGTRAGPNIRIGLRVLKFFFFLNGCQNQNVLIKAGRAQTLSDLRLTIFFYSDNWGLNERAQGQQMCRLCSCIITHT